MTEQTNPSVAVLGLGRMGTPIARAFLTAGYPTTVWNRNPAKTVPLVTLGARRAGTPAAAIRAATLVIAPLLDHEAAQHTLGTAAAELRDRTVVNLANTTPGQARELAGLVVDHGGAFLDGAMMGLPETVATEAAFFLYSGSSDAFTTHRRALEVMASAHYFGTDPGAAEIHDLALLSTGYLALTGFLHASALLESIGTSPEVFAPLATRWLHGMAEFLPELAGEAGAASYTNGVSTVAMNRVALGSLLELSTANGIPTDVHEPLQALLDRRAADGHAQDSFSSVFELLKRGRGRDVDQGGLGEVSRPQV